MVCVEKILLAYPKSKTYSPQKVIAALKATPTADWPAVIAGCSGYAAEYRDKPTTHPKALDRFISERVFENFGGKRPGPKLVAVLLDTPSGRAWDAYERGTNGKPPPWSNGRWYFPTPTPPLPSSPPQNGSMQ